MVLTQLGEVVKMNPMAFGIEGIVHDAMIPKVSVRVRLLFWGGFLSKRNRLLKARCQYWVIFLLLADYFVVILRLMKRLSC